MVWEKSGGLISQSYFWVSWVVNLLDDVNQVLRQSFWVIQNVLTPSAFQAELINMQPRQKWPGRLQPSQQDFRLQYCFQEADDLKLFSQKSWQSLSFIQAGLLRNFLDQYNQRERAQEAPF